MREFNYKRAWSELAEPAFKALPQNVRDLLDRVMIECKGLHQLDDLSMPWPKDDPIQYPYGSLRAVFDEIPMELLARAAQTVHAYGHWAYTEDGRRVQEGGAYWKFANYADQVLTEKLGLTRIRWRSFRGASYQVHEGMLRACLFYKNRYDGEGFISRDLCFATAEALAAAREIGLPIVRVSEFESACRRVRREVGMKSDAALWLNTDRFMEDDSPKGKLETALQEMNGTAPEGYSFARIDNFNFQPHPFVIGPRHFDGSYGRLDPDSAPCAAPGCKLKPAEHKSDTLAVIEVSAEKESIGAEANAWLQQLAKIVEANASSYKVDGFTFVKTEA